VTLPQAAERAQYAATLASWYGVAAGDLPTVFPNIGRFELADLGFMAWQA
jgi:hypothetical protein